MLKFLGIRSCGFMLTSPIASFICWLAIINQLSTKDRISKWQSQINPLWAFYDHEDESRNLLFFARPFVGQVWSHILAKSGIQHNIGDWDPELAWISNCRGGRSPRSTLYKLAFNSFVYTVWTERMLRVFQHENRPPLSMGWNFTFKENQRLFGSDPY